MVLPPPLQRSLPAGWLAFTGRESNPQDRYKRFQIAVSSSFSGFILAQGKFHCWPPPVRGRPATLNGPTGDHTRNFGDFCANDRSDIYLESFLACFGLERDRQRGRVRTVLAEGCRLGNSSIEKAHVMHWPRPTARRPRSVPLVRQHGQRVKLNSFLMQLLGLLRRSLAVNRAALDLAVVHLARLFGKSPPNIIGVSDEMFAQFLQLAAELALLRRHHGDRRGNIRLRRFRRRLRCRRLR